jgi:hypothetical protein
VVGNLRSRWGRRQQGFRARMEPLPGVPAELISHLDEGCAAAGRQPGALLAAMTKRSLKCGNWPLRRPFRQHGPVTAAP